MERLGSRRTTASRSSTASEWIGWINLFEGTRQVLTMKPQVSYEGCVRDLVTQLDPVLFEKTFGAPVDSWRQLLEAKSITIGMHLARIVLLVKGSWDGVTGAGCSTITLL